MDRVAHEKESQNPLPAPDDITSEAPSCTINYSRKHSLSLTCGAVRGIRSPPTKRSCSWPLRRLPFWPHEGAVLDPTELQCRLFPVGWDNDGDRGGDEDFAAGGRGNPACSCRLLAGHLLDKWSSVMLLSRILGSNSNSPRCKTHHRAGKMSTLTLPAVAASYACPTDYVDMLR